MLNFVKNHNILQNAFIENKKVTYTTKSKMIGAASMQFVFFLKKG